MHRYIALVTMNGMGSSEVLQTGQMTISKPQAAKLQTKIEGFGPLRRGIKMPLLNCLGK